MLQQQMIMVKTRPQDAYRRQDVLTASPGELVVMLYDGLKKNLVIGQRAIAKSDIQGAHNHLMKAQAIVSELSSSLDMSYKISKELYSIYDFLRRSIQSANIKKEAEILDPVIEIVDSLREAWSEVNEMNKGSLHLSEGLS